MNRDPDIARKYGNMLQSQGFHVTESKKKRVNFGKFKDRIPHVLVVLTFITNIASDGKLSQEFVASVLNAYANKTSIIAPKMGLDHEDYRHRIEMIFAECVKINAHMDWYSWVGKKATTVVS
jgi:hypothetical protein